MILHWPIRWQLSALALTVALPLTMLQGYTLYREAQRDAEQAAASALRMAQREGAARREFVVRMREVLELAAERPLMRALNPAHCDPFFREFLELDPEVTSFASVGRDGRVVCGAISGIAAGSDSLAEVPWFGEAVNAVGFFISKPFVDPATQNWVTVLSQSLAGKGLIAISLDLGTPLATQLPPGGLLVVIDEEGNVLARSGSAQHWIGKNTRGVEIVDVVLAEKEGQDIALGPDGVEKVFGFTAIAGTPWFVYVGIPTEIVYAPVRAKAGQHALLGLGVIALVAGIAYWMARQIERPIRAIAGAAAQVARGELKARAKVSGAAEIRNVAAQLNRMLDARDESDRLLIEISERLQTLSRKLMEVQESERRALARELHDEVGQILTAIKINLKAAQRSASPLINARLTDSIVVVDHAIERVRGLSLDLRPAQLDDLGLEAALRWLIERQGERAGWRTHLKVEPLPHDLSSEFEIVCFRVVQEALNNSMRHAQASTVWVELTRRADSLDLLIRDDGVGFEAAAARQCAQQGKSFGLLGMEERVHLLGGKIEIQSGPGRGTEIRATLPLDGAPVASALTKVA